MEIDPNKAIRKLISLKINPTKMAILLYLTAKGEAKFKELCEDLGLTPGNAWSHLEKLQRDGLVKMKRELPITGTKVSITLTERGYKKADELLEVLSSLSYFRDSFPSASESTKRPNRD